MLGDKIKKLRTNANMSQKELADILGIALSTVGMYERNNRIPPIDNLIKIAQHFDVSIDELLDQEKKEYSTSVPRIFIKRLETLIAAKGKDAKKLGKYKNTSYFLRNSLRVEDLIYLSATFSISCDYLLGLTNQPILLTKERLQLIERYEKLDAEMKDTISSLIDLLISYKLNG